MKRPITLLAVAAATLLLAGCGTAGVASGSSDTGAISTSVPDAPVTLTISYVSDPPITPLIDGFTKLHPNVTFKLVQTPFADYQTSLKLSMASNSSPDIVQYSPGPMRAIVPAGLVQPLDAYAKAYGWRDTVSPSLLGMLTSDKKAEQYGEGTLYAVPGAVQMIGVFYNKKVAAAAGVTAVPKTLDAFEKDLAAVKSSGVTPMTVPALGVGGFQLWSALANVQADVGVFNKWVQGRSGSTLTKDPGFTEAADTVSQWAKDDYFSKGAASVSDADGVSEFSSGKSAYFVTGNWNTKAFQDALGSDLGFFLMPGTSADQAAVATGSGFPYSISAKSKHKDVAAAFLDYMVSPEAADGTYAGGFVPVTGQPSERGSGVQGTILDGYGKVVDGEGIAPFANWATSTMIDTLTSGAQGLISGNTSAKAFVDSLQADWDKAH